MSLNRKIISVVQPVVGICVADTYDAGLEDTYSTFNYTEIPEGMGDGRPHALRCSVQVHLYLPKDVNSLAMRRELRRAIAETKGFTAPTVTNASDSDGQHFVFEFEALEVW